MTSALAGIVLQHIRRLAGKRPTVHPSDAELLERFTAQREEAAFAALVRRHGPMVLSVCRGVLRHKQDAEDAFQVTFLVLARKAETIWQKEAIAGWLYEVAHRAAIKAQADTARRRAQERRACPMAPADPTLDMTLRDIRRVLHEELRRLPEKYRLPLVLCYLEGRSQEEATGQLGWTKGTCRGRLDRGRQLLRRRLAARGVELSALLGATAVAPEAAAATLVAAVIRSAVGGAASGVLSARVAALADGVVKALFASKVKVMTAVLLAVSLVASGAGVLAHQVLATTASPAGSQRSEVRSQKPEGGSRKSEVKSQKPGSAADDSIEVSGRVVDLQGKPIAGVKVQPRSIMFREDGGDLKDFVKDLKKERPGGAKHRYMRLNPAPLGLTRPVVTGADGKFRVMRISGECIVGLRFEGPTIESTELNAMTRSAATIVTPRAKYRSDLGKSVYHGNTFDHVAAPTRPIEGTVRDTDTGDPLARVTIRAYLGSARSHFETDPTLSATTDEKGRYRLVGLSREAGHRLLAVPPKEQPYLPAELASGAAPAVEPVTLDFKLKRGVLIRGRVTDKVTGQPVPAEVVYFAFDDNRSLREAPGYRDSHGVEVPTTAEGNFTVLGLPGHGLIAVKTANRDHEGRYLMGAGADRIKVSREDDAFITHPFICDISRYNTLAEVNPAKGIEAIERDVVLDPGKTVTGTIVDPDGQPVKGASIDSVYGVWFRVEDLPTAHFRIQGIDSKHPRAFYFRDHGEKLGAAVLLTGDEAMPVRVRLQKCATITGRLVDEDGQPRPSWISGHIHKGQLNINSGVGCLTSRTGKDGRFRIEGVIPGLKIGLRAGTSPSYFDQDLVPELTLKAGEVRDLGEMKRKVKE